MHLHGLEEGLPPPQVKLASFNKKRTSNMYCGDETGAFIGEVGYSSSKFGYGGEDVPKLVVPSYVSYDQNQKKIIASGLEYGPTHRPNPSLELVHVYDHPSSWNNSDSDSIADQYLQSNGSINNWNAYENLWERAFYDLHVRDSRKWSSSSSSNKAENSCPHPICSIDQGFTSNNTNNTTNNTTAKKQNRQREKIMELLFEKFDAPAVFIAPSPACSAFSVGRPTSLVLDMVSESAHLLFLCGFFLLQLFLYCHNHHYIYVSYIKLNVVSFDSFYLFSLLLLGWWRLPSNSNI